MGAWGQVYSWEKTAAATTTVWPWVGIGNTSQYIQKHNFPLPPSGNAHFINNNPTRQHVVLMFEDMGAKTNV